MSLTNVQIEDMCEMMRIPLASCCFKSELPYQKLQYNKFYIINLEDEFNEYGELNPGSHYTGFQVNKYENGKVEGIYFDPFGKIYPDAVTKFTKIKLPYTEKDLQSITNSACGWYCLAFSHYINAFKMRSRDLYTDVNDFLNLFNDLREEDDFIKHLQNEYMLRHFFVDSNSEKRKPIELPQLKKIANPDTIITEDSDNKTKL
jgi:hypothetical protein